MDMAARHNVTREGAPAGRPIVFAPGFGCDQGIWRLVAPRFAADHPVVLFDHIGAGGTDPAAYSKVRHATLDGYAQDVLDLCRELELADVVYVGHCVSAMIGVLAAGRAPDLFAALVLINPSPRYMNDGGYVGGFGAAEIESLLAAIARDYAGWSTAMAPAIMGRPDRPELGEELTASFDRTDPEIAARLARVMFLSDNRSDLRATPTPTLVLQCANDLLAPAGVGEYVRDHMPHASLVPLEAAGHCPSLSAPDETTAAIERFLTTLGG